MTQTDRGADTMNEQPHPDLRTKADLLAALDDLSAKVQRLGEINNELARRLVTARPLDVEALVAHVERVKRSPRKSNAEWQPEDISFDVGVAAAQDAIRNYARLSQPGGSDAE